MFTYVIQQQNLKALNFYLLFIKHCYFESIVKINFHTSRRRISFRSFSMLLSILSFQKMADSTETEHETQSRNSYPMSLPTVLCTESSSDIPETINSSFINHSDSKMSLPTSPLQLSSPISLPTSPFMKTVHESVRSNSLKTSSLTSPTQQKPSQPLNSGSSTGECFFNLN